MFYNNVEEIITNFENPKQSILVSFRKLQRGDVLYL